MSSTFSTIAMLMTRLTNALLIPAIFPTYFFWSYDKVKTLFDQTLFN